MTKSTDWESKYKSNSKMMNNMRKHAWEREALWCELDYWYRHCQSNHYPTGIERIKQLRKQLKLREE